MRGMATPWLELPSGSAQEGLRAPGSGAAGDPSFPHEMTSSEPQWGPQGLTCVLRTRGHRSITEHSVSYEKLHLIPKGFSVGVFH